MNQKVAGAVLGCLGMTTLAPAQEQTASIVGVVRDMSGGVIPGTSVIAADADGLAVPAVADGAGRYRFPSLPPGRFSLTAHLSGFAPARVESIDLRLGQQLAVPITLETAALSESIRVVAESPTLAITQSARSTSIRADEIQALPNGREYTEVVDQVSGANRELTRAAGLALIDGSSGSENLFVIDGAEVTDLLYGTPGQLDERRMVTDFVEEIQVKSSGYAAEYGGSTGGVVNVVTRSGRDTWHGCQDEGRSEHPARGQGVGPPDPPVAAGIRGPANQATGDRRERGDRRIEQHHERRSHAQNDTPATTCRPEVTGACARPPSDRPSEGAKGT